MMKKASGTRIREGEEGIAWGKEKEIQYKRTNFEFPALILERVGAVFLI